MTDLNVRLVISAIDKVTAPIRKIGGVLRGFAGRAGLARIAQAGREVGLALGRVLVSVRRMATVAGIATAAAGGAVLSLVRRTALAGDEIAKTARKLGIGVEALQELRFAADRAGIGQQTFDMAMQRFTRRAAEAAAGTGEAKEALRHLGIQLKDSSGRIRPSEELLRDVADALTKIDDPALRVRIAFKLFDSEGVKMVNMLTSGSAEIDRLSKRARELGFVMSEKGARDAEDYTDAMTDFHAVLTGVRNIIGERLMPVLTPMINRLTDWIAANRELIRQRVGAVVERVTSAIERFDWSGFIVRLDRIRQRVAAFVDWMGGWRNVILSVAAVLGRNLLLSLGNLVFATGRLGFAMTAFAVASAPAIGRVSSRLARLFGAILRHPVASLGTAFVATKGVAVAAIGLVGAAVRGLFVTISSHPIGALATALIGAGFLVYKYWKPIKAFFSGLWRGFLEEIGPLRPALETLGAAAKDLLDVVTAPVRALFGMLGDLVGLFGDLTTQVEDVGGAADAAGERLGRLLGRGIADWGRSVVRFIARLRGAPSAVAAKVREAADDLVSGITRLVDDATAKVTGWVDTIKAKISEIIESIKALPGRLLDWLGLGGGSGGSGQLLMAPAPKVPAAFRLGPPAPLGFNRGQAAGPAGTQQVETRARVDLRMQIDAEGRPRVREVRSDNSDVDLAVDAGPTMFGIPAMSPV